MIGRSEKYPVRILHPITRLIVGGAQENTIFTAALLDRSRFNVEILSGAQTGREGSLIDEIKDQRIPLIIVPELVRQINPWYDQLALSKMTRIIKSGGYRIVHTHSSKAGILGRFAARRAGVPIIIHTVHGWSFHNQMTALSKWAYIWLERWAANFTDVIVVVSQNDSEKGLAYKIGHPEQYHLIRSAVPFDDFTPDMYDRSAIRRELNILLSACNRQRDQVFGSKEPLIG
jgi:glycosyltransferase involved in cell wall biosynthesis